MKCPKCESEMRFKYTSDGGMIAEREGFGIEQLSPKYVCQCGHEEKVKEVEKKGSVQWLGEAKDAEQLIDEAKEYEDELKDGEE